jgi:hypothetical protein
VAVLATAALLAGCGGNSGSGASGSSGGDSDFAKESGQQIVSSALADLKDVKSFKMAGTLTSDGEDITLDLQTDSEGDCTGSVGVKDGSAQILGVKGKTWMKPDEGFWRSYAGAAADQVISSVGDKWVALPDSDQSFNQFCDTDGLLNQLLDEQSKDAKYTTKGTDEVDGDQTVKVDIAQGDEDPSTVYVRTDDPHYPVKIEKTVGADQGSITLSKFDEDFDVQAPAADDVVDLSSLAG